MTLVPPARPIYDQSKEWRGTPWEIFCAAGIIIAASLVAYCNSFFGHYLLDDLSSIPNNPYIRHLWPFRELLFPSHQDLATINGRPLIKVSLALNYALGGTAVWGYHVVNLLIHMLAGRFGPDSGGD